MDLRTPRDYFDAGMELLAQGGVAAVTVARLCAALGVTKGSFYHHFTGVEDYKERLLTDWAVQRERQVMAAVAAVPDPLGRLTALAEFCVELPHEAEAAIRNWSHTDAGAHATRAKVDAARERAVADAYREVGMSPDVAELFGRLAVAVLIGAQHRGETTDRELLRTEFRWLINVSTSGVPAISDV